MNEFLQTLPEFYERIRTLQSGTPFFSRMSLALALMLVATGNQKPGYRLLTGVLLAHFIIGLYVTSDYPGAAFLLIPIHLVMIASLGWTLYADDSRWVVLPEDGSWSITAIGAYIAIFWFPFFPPGFRLSDLFFSPMGLLPHQTLLVSLMLLLFSRERVSVALIWTVVGCSAYLALLEVLTQRFFPAIVLLVLAGAVVYQQLKPQISRFYEPREKPRPKAKEAKPAAPPQAPVQEKSTKTGRKWDIR